VAQVAIGAGTREGAVIKNGTARLWAAW
jgi:hypothetical protein